MAPEHMWAESVVGRADLFSLGVVLFEAVAGVRPFDGSHDVETMQKILGGERLRLEDEAPEAPSAWTAIIDRLLAVDRESRTPSAEQLLEELAEIMPPPATRRALATRIEDQCGGPQTRLHVRPREERDTELTGLPPGIGPGRPDEPPPRRRWVWALAALVVAVSLGFAFTLARRPSTDDASIAAAEAAATQTLDVGDRIAEVSPPSPAETNSASKPSTSANAKTNSTNPVADEPLIETKPAPAASTRGWVRVVVEPWGNVWIDGRYLGRAPVRARLHKGRHVIQAGRELPTERRVVRVQPGTRKEVQLTLGAE
jgi:serine/threonine protein kinase